MTENRGLILKATVGKGRTIERNGVWEKKYLEFEIDTSSCKDDLEVEKVVKRTEGFIDQLLQRPDYPAEATSGLGIPKIDLAELDDCPWQTYQKKPAKPGQPAWIKNPVQFTGWQDPPKVLIELVKALHKTEDKKLILGDVEYSFSGKDKETGDPKPMFISRQPVKT